MITWINAITNAVPVNYDCLLLMSNGDVFIGRPSSNMAIVGWSAVNRPDWINHNHKGAVSGISRKNGERHHNAKLTDSDCNLIRALADDGMDIRTIAQKFETSRSTIRDIATYRTRYLSSDG